MVETSCHILAFKIWCMKHFLLQEVGVKVFEEVDRIKEQVDFLLGRILDSYWFSQLMRSATVCGLLAPSNQNVSLISLVSSFTFLYYRFKKSSDLTIKDMDTDNDLGIQSQSQAVEEGDEDYILLKVQDQGGDIVR